jgi:type II secretory ATPase GspE/PulE/Tfp pilus assembly ATPase PilB-like protein/ActR/RegA family two-component response regulator
VSRHTFLGELLISKGVIDAGALTRATAEASARGATLGWALANLGLADEVLVAQTLATALHLGFVSSDPRQIGRECSGLLPAEFCRKRSVIPIHVDGGLLQLGMSDPLDYAACQDAEFRTGKKAVAVVVTHTWLEKALDVMFAEARASAYNELTKSDPAGELEPSADEEYDLVDPNTLANDTRLPPIVRLVNLMLTDAARSGASDVHIEPQESTVLVRQRVDGMLREVLTIPLHLRDQTISRIKIISGMDIAERRKPQDGRSRLRFEGRRIDLRVSTLPTQFGEKVVIRLLNSDRSAIPIDQLGMNERELRTIRSFLTRPQGLILVTGPTGSGKTSTLYAALNALKSSSTNIVTLEDPIEIQVPGVNQMQINPRAGVTFASGLRSILRQDPNVVLVGEIRDQETAEIALQAAQTGHLLLSTVHTNNAPATVTRLFDLGIQPFVVAASLVGIVAQRLVRRVCAACAVPQTPSRDIIERLGGASLPAGGRWLTAPGCDRCAGSGFKGRVAVHEVLEVDDTVRELISNHAPEHALRDAVRSAGMRTLLEDAIDKAAQGLTTLEEVLRVVSPDEPRRSAPAPSPAPATAPQAVATTTVSPNSQNAVAQAPAATGERQRVLVVEDSPTVAAVVKYFLELEGFEVLMAGDGNAGLQIALTEFPSLIVTDLNMPGMSGMDMVRAIRADARAHAVRILMLTSESSVESEAAGLEAGADDYIAKPVEPKRLAARVKVLLGHARMRVA